MRKISLFFRLFVPGILLVLLSGSFLLGAGAIQLPQATPRSFVSALGIPGISGSNPVHLLLVGLDQPEGETVPLVQSIGLCTIRRDDGTMSAVTVSRDLYVEIPGYGNRPIHAAFSLGGLPLLRQTLEETFQLELTGCICVDFSLLPQVVDAGGGVTLTLDQEEIQAMNKKLGSSLTKGENQLNGEQTMAYWQLQIPGQEQTAQLRRQKAVITAYLARYKGSGLTEITSLMKDIAPLLSTDMKKTRLLGLALEIFPILSRLQVTSHQIPSDGSYTQETRDGASVKIVDTEALRQQMHTIVQTGGDRP